MLQGEAGDKMFIIASGAVNIEILATDAGGAAGDGGGDAGGAADAAAGAAADAANAAGASMLRSIIVDTAGAGETVGAHARDRRCARACVGSVLRRCSAALS